MVRHTTRYVCCIVVVAALLGMPACGGGGGGSGAAAPPVEIDLGLFSATVPTTTARTFTNPLSGGLTTVTALASTGPFQVDAAGLPPDVLPDGPAQIPILFTPMGSGPHEGQITLRWQQGAAVVDEVFVLRATGEPIDWTVTPDEPAFGDLLPGQTGDVDVTVRNESGSSPVTFTSVSLPAGVTLVAPALPLTVPSLGGTRTLTLRFAPTILRNYDGLVRLGPDDPGGDLRFILRAESSGNGEEIIDLGTQSLTGGLTPELSVDVHRDAISLTIEAAGAIGDRMDIHTLEGPGGRVYQNTSGTGLHLSRDEVERFATRIPSTNETNTQLVQGGGTYRFRIEQLAGSSTELDVRVIVERRASADASAPALLPLNIWLAGATGISAANAPADVNMTAMLARVDAILAPQSIRVGDVDFYDINDPTYDDVTQGEMSALLRRSQEATENRLNVFLVRSVFQGQLLGISGAINGAKQKGAGVSGVISHWNGLTPNQAGMVLAHECAHYLGVWHITEGNGQFDRISDTPECPPTGTNGTCAVEGGGYLMFWIANGGTTISNGQGLILRTHPHLQPDPNPPASPKRRVPLPPLTEAEKEGLRFAWCGCCAHDR